MADAWETENKLFADNGLAPFSSRGVYIICYNGYISRDNPRCGATNYLLYIPASAPLSCCYC